MSLTTQDIILRLRGFRVCAWTHTRPHQHVKLSNSINAGARNQARGKLFELNLGSWSYIPCPLPHDLSSYENCHSHLQQKSRATVPRPGSSSRRDVPVQAGPQRQVVHLALHTILQHFGEACDLAVVEHLDLRGQQFDDLRTFEVHRDSFLRGSLPRILRHQNRSSCHHLSTGARKLVYFSDTDPYEQTHSKTFARLQ